MRRFRIAICEDDQMEGTNGLELARRLYRQGVRDRVVFVIGRAEYAPAGYDARLLHYPLKPVSREKLWEALALVLAGRPQATSGTGSRGPRKKRPGRL